MIFTPVSMDTLIEVCFGVGIIGLFIVMLIPDPN